MNHRLTRTALALLFVSLLVALPQARQRSLATRQPLDLVATAAGSDTSADRVALYQALLDLTNPWTVMCVAAHPDDEDGTSLIVMRHKYGAHTVSLFSTFGEGGQNAIGPELYEELGAIRARETMAAAEIQGSEPHFLGLKDFGYSKTRAEAFKFWGHEEALRRMVLEIRKLRPDVIITNHSTTSNDHGQHQATALMVVEAFDAAADPNRFPEQLKDGVTTWQVQRLFVRARGNQQNADAQFVTIDPNEKDPVRGIVYGEEAWHALQQHATQGPWPKTFAEYANRFRAFSGQTAPTGQLPLIRYILVKSAKETAAMPDQESHNFLDGLRLPDSEAALIVPPTIAGQPLVTLVDRPYSVLYELARSSERVSKEHGSAVTPRAIAMRDRLFHAMGAASAITISIKPQSVAVPSTVTDIAVTLVNNGTNAFKLRHLELNGTPVVADLALSVLPAGGKQTFTAHYDTPANAQLSLPHSEHLYDGAEFGRFLNVAATFSFVEEGEQFIVPAETNIDVAPAVEIKRIDPKPLVITKATAKQPHKLTVTLVNHQLKAFRGSISVGAERLPAELQPQQEKSFPLDLRRIAPGMVQLKVETNPSGGHAEILPVVFPDVSVSAHLNVAYIRGFDFSLPNALDALGVESKELSVDDVKTADLSKFTSVIVDNRVYESKPELIAVNQKLLDYAQAGGTLIVFYHKSNEWNPDPRRNRPQLAPYKLILGEERITDENAPITFLEPEHPLLNVPNKIGQDDFKDWIQERGLYYPREWDPQFHALLESNDPGESPLKGGLLVADYGKGHYIYTSMVWYRELRGGIPGAYRMLANMISYGRD